MSDASVSLEIKKGHYIILIGLFLAIQTCLQLSETGNSYNGCVVCPNCNLISHSSLQLFFSFFFLALTYLTHTHIRCFDNITPYPLQPENWTNTFFLHKHVY